MLGRLDELMPVLGLLHLKGTILRVYRLIVKARKSPSKEKLPLP